MLDRTVSTFVDIMFWEHNGKKTTTFGNIISTLEKHKWLNPMQ